MEGTKRTKGGMLTLPTGIVVLILIVTVGLGFLGGVAYQKSQGSTSPANTDLASQNAPTNGGPGGFGGSGGSNFRQMRGGFGEVTAVTSSSITVRETMSGSSTTYTINDSTKVTNDGDDVSVSDIKVGDTVIVRTNSNDNKVATQITINPSMPNGPMGGNSPSADTEVQTN